jgi:protein-tyrosine phosphatase
MSVLPLLPDRRVRLEGPLNFRDLGGYLTKDGGMVCWRQIFRSDSLESASSTDVDTIVNHLGIKTVVDLRTDGEIARSAGHSRLLPGVESCRVTLVDRPGFTDPMFYPGVGLDELYLLILNRSAERIVDTLRLLADAPRPMIFHCSAGKDRTGLVAAILLGVLGVGDDDIVRDYALSSHAMMGLVERLRGGHPASGSTVLPPEAYEADPAFMRAVLEDLRHRHGAVVGYATDHGLSFEVVRRLRSELVE